MTSTPPFVDGSLAVVRPALATTNLRGVPTGPDTETPAGARNDCAQACKSARAVGLPDAS